MAHSRMTDKTQLKKQISNMRDLTADVADSPKVKKVHGLRIMTRKMRASAWLLEKQKVADFDSKETKKTLKKLGRRLGKSRELDVLKEDSKTYSFKAKKIKNQGEKVDHKLQKTLTKKFRENLEQDLGILAQHWQVPSASQSAKIREQILVAIKKWPEQFPQKKSDLHSIRIDAKKMIYRLEILGEYNQDLKDLQKHLGRVHDLEILEKKFSSKKEINRAMKQHIWKARASYYRILDKF